MNSTTITYEKPDSAGLIATGEGLLLYAQSLSVTDAAGYSTAANDLRECKQRVKQLNEQRLEVTRPLDAAKSAVMDLFKRPTELLTAAAKVIEKEMLRFDDEQTTLRREQERLAAAEVEKQNALLIEAQAQIMASEDGNKSEQLGVLIESVKATVAAPTPLPAPITAAGTSVKGTWVAECTDKASLVVFIAANPKYLELLEVNTSELNRLARATEGRLGVPGCEATLRRSVASR